MGVVQAQGRVLQHLATLIRAVQSSIVPGGDTVQAGDIDAE